MHQSSFERMRRFADQVRERFAGKTVRVLDVGSMGVNGTYKELFSFPGVQYVGLDIAPGPNVDVVPRDAYCWPELEDESFDVVVSGQALEHIEFPWRIVREIARKLKVGGQACLIAPSRGPEHRYPVDCYRYYPDGMRALAKWAGLSVVEADMVRAPTGYSDGSDQWGDCHCVLVKEASAASAPDEPPLAAPTEKKASLVRHAKNPLDLGQNEPYYLFCRQEVIDLILAHKLSARSAVELGCSAGATGQKLKEVLGIARYVGVERFEEAAQAARGRLDQVLVADLNRTSPLELGLEEGSFDLLLALDVLEHLYNPWDVLAAAVKLVRPGGSVVLSLPNTQNIALVMDLVHGRWNYQSAGLLDATHVRFFCLAQIVELVEGAGLEILGSHATLNPPLDQSQLRDANNSLTQGRLTLRGLSRDECIQFFTYQYILLARRPG